jgi:membrane protein YqaA with SNARE-associated domain
MSFPLTILVLTTGASLGCWVSYIQGRWLGNTPKSAAPINRAGETGCGRADDIAPAGVITIFAPWAYCHCRIVRPEQCPLSVF